MIHFEIRGQAFLRKIISKISKKWGAKYEGKALPIVTKISPRNMLQYEKPHSISLNSGQSLDVFVEINNNAVSSKDWMDFLSKGKSFFVSDTTGKKFYLSKKDTEKIKSQNFLKNILC